MLPVKMALPIGQGLFRSFRKFSVRHFLKYESSKAQTLHIRCSHTAKSDNTYRLVETDTVGHVYMVGINRPEVRNCVNPTTAKQLCEAFQEFEQNGNLWVAVLYGKGGCFCSGYDLKALSQMDGKGDFLALDPQKERPMGPTKMIFSKPVIAAISGYATAGGLELALTCDLRVMEDTATLGVFCRRWGVPLVDGGTVRLQKLIGLSRALDLILTGRPVSAKEAYDYGLANRVVPPGTAVGEAVKLAQVLCTYPQACLRADRQSTIHAAYDSTSFEDAMAYEAATGVSVLDEAVQGAGKFIDGDGRHGEFGHGMFPKSKL